MSHEDEHERPTGVEEKARNSNGHFASYWSSQAMDNGSEGVTESSFIHTGNSKNHMVPYANGTPRVPNMIVSYYHVWVIVSY